MESLLRGMASSTDSGGGHSPELKKAFLTKMLSSESLYDAVTSVQEVTALLRLFLEWVLQQGESPGMGGGEDSSNHLVDHGKQQFARLARVRPQEFRDHFVSPNLIIDIFTNSMYSNKAETAEIVGIILDLLKAQTKNEDSDERESHDNPQQILNKIRSVINVARCHLERFLREHGVHLPVAGALGDLYRRHPELLPQTPEARSRLANSVVRMLAGFRTPAVMDGADCDFLGQAERFSGIVSQVWSAQPDCINDCLHTYYNVISTGDSYSRPSCALLCVIDKIPGPLLDSAMQAMIELSTKNSNDKDEGRTVAALQTMIEWLTQRPSPLLSARLLDLLRGLHKSNRNSVLIEITHATSEKLLQSLTVSKLQDSVEPIFFFLLLGFQHSETVFHQLVTALPDVFKQLTKSVKVQQMINRGVEGKSQKILDKLSEACAFLMDHQFSGFPELYAELAPWVAKSKLAENPLSDDRVKELQSLAWVSSSSYIVDLQDPQWQRSQPLASSKGFTTPGTSSKATESQNLRRPEGQRSLTGMVGLINLGNTCYMNSVLQALYITKAFCELVLAAGPASPSQQPVLAKLQVTFSYLRHTMRSIYSPSDLLKIARPPWFESGRQQDCSEFLRYLLDTLHEQEKSSYNLAVKTSRASNTSIPSSVSVSRGSRASPSSSSQAQHSSGRLHPDSEGGADSDQAKVRPSFSTTALDSISEDPVEENSGPPLQGSSSDSTKSRIPEPPELASKMSGSSPGTSNSMASGFGSRTNLASSHIRSVPAATCDVSVHSDSDQEEEEDDGMMLTGSRGSLLSAGGGGGGGGLKGSLNRWTTEENLSFDGGSREDKMDTLVDGPFLHDSHSNSTDSGIQSVGDSIRGSSDSVTNKNEPASVNNKPPSSTLTPTSTSSSSINVSPSCQKTLTNSWTTASHQQSHVSSNINNQTESACPPGSSDGFSSIVDKVFGGRMETTYTCSKCNHHSKHNESFTDLHLAFPNQQLKSAEDKNVTETQKEEPLSVQDLVNNYLSPEKLCGENQYRCDGCSSLQDALKVSRVTRGPTHLMATLLRFNYDRKLNRKSKVCRDLKYDLTLSIPVRAKGISNAHQTTDTTAHPAAADEVDTYQLYGIVVHSGYSSDGGHYYTYARDLSVANNSESESVWYVFNDSKVSFTTFESFVKLSQRFPVDTAYVLFYQRKGFQGFNAPLPKNDLTMAVERDNIKFMREKERGSSSSVTSSSSGWTNQQRRGDDKDEDEGPSGGGGGGYSSCGTNSAFDSGPGRFIC